MNVSNLHNFSDYVNKLAIAADMPVKDFASYLDALKKRHAVFAEMGCRISDHGLEKIDAEDHTAAEVKNIFEKALQQQSLSACEQSKFRTAMLLFFAQLDYEKGWVQQFHLGALRNNNTRRLRELGPDTGYSIGDFPQAQSLSTFLSRLDDGNSLQKQFFTT